MNLPNKLTVFRIFLVPAFLVALLVPQIAHRFLLAALIFALASFSDHLDGKFARKYNLITDFGKFADPLADKILVISALIAFVQLQLIGAVAVIIVIAREFMVTSIRLVASGKGKVISANFWGKAKTVSQFFAILAVLILQYLGGIGVFAGFSREFLLAGQIAIWISVVLTVISGAVYLWQNREFIRQV